MAQDQIAEISAPAGEDVGAEDETGSNLRSQVSAPRRFASIEGAAGSRAGTVAGYVTVGAGSNRGEPMQETTRAVQSKNVPSPEPVARAFVAMSIDFSPTTHCPQPVTLPSSALAPGDAQRRVERVLWHHGGSFARAWIIPAHTDLPGIAISPGRTRSASFEDGPAAW